MITSVGSLVNEDIINTCTYNVINSYYNVVCLLVVKINWTDSIVANFSFDLNRTICYNLIIYTHLFEHTLLVMGGSRSLKELSVKKKDEFSYRGGVWNTPLPQHKGVVATLEMSF